MYLKTQYIFDNDKKDYRIIVGTSIVDGKLDGRGKDITVKGDQITLIIGTFKDGRLNGIGAKLQNDVCVESGLYKDGVLVDEETFKRGAKKVVIPETTKYGNQYADSELYYHEGEETNISGYTLLVCDKLLRFFITKSERIEGEKSCLRYAEFKDNKEVGLLAFKNYQKGKGTTYDYSYDAYERETAVLWNKDVDRRYFEWKTAKAEEGMETLPKGFVEKTQRSIILHLPHSIKKLEDSAISSDVDYYLEVFYDGTKEEWDAIEKGRYEDYVYEDFYGYYYHNSERYVMSRRFFDWAKNADFIAIHCLDGDLYSKDCSY